MSISNKDAHTKLSTLMSEEQHNEVACREYLIYALDLLIPYSGITTILENESEYPSHTGPSDLIIFCEREYSGIKQKLAFIWEVKSPQTYLFTRDTNNRVKPTTEFVQAENQLLHYWNDCRTEQFRSEFELTSIDHIKLGGVLIGQKSKLVKGDYEEPKKKRLYDIALNLRAGNLYQACNIQVRIWDDILGFIKPLK